MKLIYHGNVKHPNARALARNLGVSLVPGVNEIDDEKARQLLKIYPKAFSEAPRKTALPVAQPAPKPKLEKAKERIRKRIRTHEGTGEMERKQLEERAMRSIEGAARSGVPVEQAEKTVEKSIERGMSGEEIEKVTRAMAYGADKDVDYDALGRFVDRKMEEGERGDELAMSVYKEIDDRSAEKQLEKKEPEKKVPWYKRIFRRD